VILGSGSSVTRASEAAKKRTISSVKSQKELAGKLAELESRVEAHDEHITALFEAICHSIFLPASGFFRILKGMEVHFNSNLEARLTERATQQGRKPEEFVQDVVARYLEEEDRLIEAVKRGEDALERGEYLTHEQVGERLRRFLQP